MQIQSNLASTIAMAFDECPSSVAFQGIKTPMGVATYDNIRLQEIKSQLPSEEAIQKRLEQAEEYILKLKEKNK